MRIESEDKGGSEAEETREELTMREMGNIFPKTEEAEKQERKNEVWVRKWKGLTSFGISQIVNKNCLSRAEDSFIAELDTETEETRAGDCWMTCWRDGGERRERDRGELLQQESQLHLLERNTFDPRVATEFGKVTALVKPEQPSNAELAMIVTEEGRVKEPMKPSQ
jgi:hypothetical protein